MSHANFPGKRLCDRIELYVEAICLEKKIFSVLAAAEGDPFHGTFGEGNFFCRVASEIEPRNKRMFETRAKRSARAMKIAAGVFLLQWRRAHDDAIDFDGGARRCAGDGQFFRGDTNGNKKKVCANGKETKTHEDDPSEFTIIEDKEHGNQSLGMRRSS